MSEQKKVAGQLHEIAHALGTLGMTIAAGIVLRGAELLEGDAPKEFHRMCPECDKPILREYAYCSNKCGRTAVFREREASW